MMKLKQNLFGSKDSQRPTVTPRAVNGVKENPGSVARTSKSLLWNAALSLLTLGTTLLPGAATKVSAAERLRVLLGPFEHSVDIAELESFAQTGKLPASLKPYAFLLTPQVQQLLNRRLQIDPKVVDKYLDDLMRSPTGKQLLGQIRAALPSSSPEQVRGAVALAARQANGLNAIGLLRAYPGEDITVDASALSALILQFNAPYLQSQALTSLLESGLTVPDSSFRPTFNPAVAGSEQVRKQTLTLQDGKRNRTLPVDIYWNERSTGQLVVMSHGLGANRGFLAYLARHLASHGLTVVALDHPDSKMSASTGASTNTRMSRLVPASEFVERPRDISIVLDSLAQLNQEPGSLQGKLNTEQVTVIGHSFGGYTALAVAGAELNLDELRQFCSAPTLLSQSGGDWLQCAASDLPDRRLQLRDRRVASAIALNPVAGQLFGKNGLSKVTIPTLILSGTSDSITPALSHQLRPFAKLGGSKYLLTAIGGTHLSITDPDNINPQVALSTLVPEVTGSNASPVRELLRGVSLAFVKQLTPEAKNYQQFLTPAYAQSLSTKGLELRLTTQLPPSISAFVDLP